MILVDTSIWIEFFKAREPYFSRITDLLEQGDVLSLSWIFGELLQGAKDKRETTLLLEVWNNLPKMDEAQYFILAGLESGNNKWIDKGIGLIDSAIIMAARATSAQVWTLDKKLKAVLKAKERYEWTLK